MYGVEFLRVIHGSFVKISSSAAFCSACSSGGRRVAVCAVSPSVQSLLEAGIYNMTGFCGVWHGINGSIHVTTFVDIIDQCILFLAVCLLCPSASGDDWFD